jgi:hypothetical protein
LALTETGTWSIGTFAKAQLSGGAGTNFTGTQTSAVGAVKLTIKNTSMTGWNMTVRRVDVNWNGILHVFVKRTGNGTGAGTVSGGLVYQEITTANVVVFSGAGNKTNIPLQFQLTGLSVAVGIGTFSSSIVYTITEF